MNSYFLMAAIAVVIIVGLAFYVGILISKIKTQKAAIVQREDQEKAQTLLNNQQRNDDICQSIRLIACATAQKQCNVSEAAIRLSVLLETLILDQAIDIQNEYPALSELFDKVKEMPTHEQRKKVAVKELKKLDRQRHIFEAELEQAIIQEASQLKNFSV
ncbi:DUF2489 domain-containing protein [Psychromonas antarctica]|jgi:hypothetical protein|uniref:DUF2489 domain-containing protein n=1 Tax=Psychromonas antarctica TaxID=67573 RepID=UPI001EE7DE5C|nr:DUF2489 domain-containing protein [Psychromonas antarctica]MCG6201169.1 DUF2489 domain-containing protein [Psychromonas antarctica]